MIFLLFAITGLFTGVIAGLLGIGGGVIAVPALYYIFLQFGHLEKDLMHVCIATSLASTFLTSIGSTWAHRDKAAIIKSILKIMAPGLVVGCILGVFFTYYLHSDSLRMIFGSMAIAFAMYFFFPKLPSLNIAPSPNKSLMIFGTFFGCLSSLLGIGGGIFMVPTLLGYHVSMKDVVAVSSAGTLITAFFGSIAFLIISWNRTPAPYTLGYIEIPAFLLIGLCSLLTTSLGVKLSQYLSSNLIKRIFALALAATGLAMLSGK